MVFPGHHQRGRTPTGHWASRYVAVFLLGALSPVAAGDPYLDAVDEEAAKVGKDTTVNNSKSMRRGASGDTSARTADSSKAGFEALLRREHLGTYSFYRKLSQRSRDEIFGDYRDGASITALREKIVDRYLHP